MNERTVKGKVIEWAQRDVLILEAAEKQLGILMSDGRIMFQNAGSTSLNEYNADMVASELYTINKIYKLKYEYGNISDIFNKNHYIVLWERPEEVIELTLDEIAKQFKCKISQLKIKL